MTYRRLLLVLLLLSLGSLAHLVSARQPDALTFRELGPEPQGARPHVVIKLHGDRLSVQARNAPWNAVLQELERHTGIRTRLEGVLPGALTREFEAPTLEQGLRRLFRDANLVLFYTKATGEGITTEPLTGIWLFPKEGNAAKQQDMHGPLAKAENGIPRDEETKSEDEVAADEAQDERFKALEASAREGDEEALRKALFEEDEITQEKALDLLAARDQQGAIATVLDATRSDQPETRLQALHLLHETRHAEESIVLSALGTALADEDITVKGYAIQALAHRGGPGAMEALRQALHDPAPTVRKLVIANVVQYDQGLPLLQEALSDVDETVRSLAALKLEQGVSNEQADGKEGR